MSFFIIKVCGASTRGDAEDYPALRQRGPAGDAQAGNSEFFFHCDVSNLVAFAPFGLVLNLFWPDVKFTLLF